jgi:hypothetical protein
VAAVISAALCDTEGPEGFRIILDPVKSVREGERKVIRLVWIEFGALYLVLTHHRGRVFVVLEGASFELNKGRVVGGLEVKRVIRVLYLFQCRDEGGERGKIVGLGGGTYERSRHYIQGKIISVRQKRIKLPLASRQAVWRHKQQP